MSEISIAALVCLCVLAGGALGAGLRSVLPEHHMSEQSRQVVNVAIGLIATLSALVLGLLVASAKSSLDAASSEIIRDKLWQLSPRTDAQRWLHARALVLTTEIEQARWLLVESSQSSTPRPFLIVLAFWLAAIFAALGLFAPRNATVYVVLFVCALSVSTAVLMIFEMDQPFEGVLQVSNAPLRAAVDEMKQ